MTHRVLGIGIAGLCFGATEAYAQDITLDVDPEKAAQFALDVDTLEQELEGKAAETLNLGEPQAFIDSMANASGIAAKGMGVDYASNMKAFVVGGGFGSAAHAVGFNFNRSDDYLPPGGFAFMIYAMAGVNLGVLDGGTDTFLDRMRVYVNGMSISMPGDRAFGGEMYNLGVHGQLKVVPQMGNKVVEWGGLDITSGWNRAQYRLELSRAVPISAPLGNGVMGTWTADGSYEIVSTTDSIPVELSTNVKVVLVTFYAGGGVDVNTSRASSGATLTGPIEATYKETTEELGTGTMTLAYDGIGDPIVPRGFGGVQFNLSVVRIYGHLNVGANGSVGGHLGARVAM